MLPPVQARQRIPPVAGVPVERSFSQPQRATPQLGGFAPPAGRIERPAITNPGRIERPVMSNPGRIERPVAANSGHGVERRFDRPQSRGDEGHGHSSSGGGRGEFRGGDRNR